MYAPLRYHEQPSNMQHSLYRNICLHNRPIQIQYSEKCRKNIYFLLMIHQKKHQTVSSKMFKAKPNFYKLLCLPSQIFIMILCKQLVTFPILKEMICLSSVSSSYFNPLMGNWKVLPLHYQTYLLLYDQVQTKVITKQVWERMGLDRWVMFLLSFIVLWL